jgi:hypothetical protein
MNAQRNRITDTGLGSPVGHRLARAMWPTSSITVWLGCVAYMALAAILVNTALPVAFVDKSQAGFFEPSGIIAVGALGLLGAWLSTRTGFPDAWSPRISNYRRFVLPSLIGIAFAAVFLLTAVASDMARLQEERFGVQATDIAFPASVLVYSVGAIVSEVVFRLLPIPALLWLLSNILLRGRGQERVFWALAVLTSAIEPIAQSEVMHVLPLYAFAFVVLQQFGGNLAQAALFRKYGFLAAIMFRIGFYLVWHLVGAPIK